MQKWGCQFDGLDPYTFLERKKELQQVYQLSKKRMLRSFSELLKGDALLWYRNEIRIISFYGELLKSLRQHYLSPDELINLETLIAARKQEANESFKNYVNFLRTLMRRDGS